MNPYLEWAKYHYIRLLTKSYFTAYPQAKEFSEHLKAELKRARRALKQC